MEKIRFILGVVVVLAGLSIVVGLVGEQLFRQRVRREVGELFAKSRPQSGNVIADADLQTLPEPVQRWLRHTGTIGRRPVATVRLKQRGQIRGAPEQPWSGYQAEQYFTMDPPGFIWSGSLKQGGFLPIRARDRYDDGRGTMLVKLFSIILVADAKGPNNDQSTLARYLAEMSWFPTAALSPHIRWEAIDSGSARVTMSYGGATVSAVYRFDEAGDVTSSEMLRYCGLTGRMELFEGRPEGGTWKLPSGDLQYVRPQNLEVEYDVPAPF